MFLTEHIAFNHTRTILNNTCVINPEPSNDRIRQTIGSHVVRFPI